MSNVAMSVLQTQPFDWSWQCQTRRKALNDEFFEDGDRLCNQAFKQIALIDKEEENKKANVFSCQISSCKHSFSNVSSYELHYRTAHCHVCQTCHRSFPTDHLLDVHILEWHDTMFQILAQKQNMFQCLLATCKEKFATAEERKDHMVKSHKYPANFRFDRPRKHRKSRKPAQPEVSAPNPSEELLSGSMEVDVPLLEQSTVSTRLTEQPSGQEKKRSASHVSESGRRFVFNVPRSLCFGHGVSRGFYYPKKSTGKKKSRHKGWHQTNKPEGMDTSVDIREVQMTDLAAALE